MLRKQFNERWRKFKRRLENHRSIRRARSSSTPPVFVYQMGKVASSTITTALRNIEGLNVFQIHRLSPENIQRFRDNQLAKGWKGAKTDEDDTGRAIFYGLIQRGCAAKVICPVRDPISRNISAYFQNLDLVWQTPKAHEAISLDKLIAEFPDRYLHYIPVEWFDAEFKTVLGIDIYQHEFPHDTGCLRVRNSRFDALIMRYDLDDQTKEKYIADLLDLENLSFATTQKNISSNKAYGEVYKKFVDGLVLPESYIDQMLETKYTRHFYTPAEIEQLRSKWTATEMSLEPSAYNLGR